MAPETTSITYDLGGHVLEVIQERAVLIAAHPSGNDPIKELVQLNSDEAYKLLVTLQTLFQ